MHEQLVMFERPPDLPSKEDRLFIKNQLEKFGGSLEYNPLNRWMRITVQTEEATLYENCDIDFAYAARLARELGFLRLLQSDLDHQIQYYPRMTS